MLTENSKRQAEAGDSERNDDEYSIHINGRPENGKAISLDTGKPVEIEERGDESIRFIGRSASQEAEDDMGEEIQMMRSMARRKKEAAPEELAPNKCREPGCDKEFKRQYDLTKHEKRHSRPWKCPVSTCKYHEYGWPTEKEMERHHSDKHSMAPPMYECAFKPCIYMSKRESNCKQHMEKAHGWHYVRSNPNGKKRQTPDFRLQDDGSNEDFILFPSDSVTGPMFNESLFAPEVPNMATGYSEPTSQDFLNTFNGLGAFDESVDATLPGEYGDFTLFNDPNTIVDTASKFPTPNTDSGYGSVGRLSMMQTPEDVPQDPTGDAGEVDYAATVYSVAQSVSEDDVEMYTLQFAETLVDYVTTETAKRSEEDAQLVEALGRSLPRLLRAFALRLGCTGSGRTEREIMFFIHKYRNNIASRFQSALAMDSQSCGSGGSSHRKERVDMSTVHAFIRGWLDGLGNDDIEPPFQLPDLDDEGFDAAGAAGEEDDDIIALPSKGDYTKIVFKSAAYLWLTAALKRELSLATVPGQERTCGRIHNQVVRHLEAGCPKEVSNRRPSERFTLNLTADWDPVAFLKQQFAGSTGPLGKLLAETITLTGSATDAQALPCEMYIRQTWPASGPCLLSILKRALDSGSECEGTLPDKTFIKLKVDSRLSVEVQGSSDSVAEVVEQIAWLGAAMRTSETDKDLFFSLPVIDISPHLKGLASKSVCSLHFLTRKISSDPSTAGQCWHKLFRNPVVVEGYPIPRRSRYNSGLEVPLNMMSRLTESPRIHQYAGKSLLKGFSTAVFPTDTMDGALVWHLSCTDDGSRLPYPNFEDIRCVDTALDEIANGRHILGWCTEARICAGSKDMNYDIKGSKLKPPGKDFCLEKVSFSVGQIVTGGCQFSVGHKDIPVRITRGGYIAKLRWIRQRYFTLWDVDDNRGWLVDGASTLLHLLRASLHQSSTDEFSTEFLFDESQFREPSQQAYNTGAALEVLLNQTNRALVLYREEQRTETIERVMPDGRIESTPHTRVQTTTIQDRTEQLYETLEKLVDHKTRVEASYKGVNAKPRLHDRLEGWDFADLAGDRDPFHLKVATLPTHAISTTWVDYTRAIPAVTLFGRGFGDLVRPSTICPKQQICQDWAMVPRDQHYLCVSVADLRTITERIGDASTNPVTIAPGITWHISESSSPTSPFSRCACEGSKTPATFHPQIPIPIQELAPSAMNFLYNRDNTALAAADMLSTYPNGALIFGTPPTRKWSWKATPQTTTTTALLAEHGSEKDSLSSDSDLSHKTSRVSLSFSSGSSSRSQDDLNSNHTLPAGATTPPTSVATSDEGSGSGRREEQAKGGGSDKKRGAWWTWNDDRHNGGDSSQSESAERESGLLRRIKRARASGK